MNGRNFYLKPFSPLTLPNVKIKGSISRNSANLIINYGLFGPLAELVIPALSDIPARKKVLWKKTCFELFIGARSSGRYREFNFSPAGHWNVYSFSAYRQGMQEEQAFTELPFSVRRKSDTLRISIKIDLDKIHPANQAIEVAVSAVIKPLSGDLTYWALNHPGQQADFHLRESFVINL